MIHLVDVYFDAMVTRQAVQFLYRLLAERKVAESISHKRHPTYAEHEQFVRSKPYLGWYVIQDGDELIGACYITKHREVGIWLKLEAKGRGAGKAAMRLLLAMHPGRVFTNTSIHNAGAFAFYKKCGFRHCANMLECDNVPGGGDRAGPPGVDAAAGQGTYADRGHPGARLDIAGGEGGEGG